MNKIPYHNTTGNPKHIGGVTVMPGQTRLVDSNYVVGLVQSEQGGSAAFDLAAYMAKNQTQKVDELPTLSAEEFAEVYAFKAVNDTPKKLATAIDERFDNAERAEQLLSIEARLAVVSDDELNLALLDYAEFEDALVIAQAELAKRAELSQE